MSIPTPMEVELHRACIMTRKDRKQRWVYQDLNGAHITEQPIPCRDAVSVYWIPIVEAIGYS